MGTYAIASLSGSSGKTTSAVTLGTRLAMSGLRTRIIDIDSQANSSIWLGYTDTHGKTVADVLRKQATIADVELPARIVRGYDEDENPVFGAIPNLTLVPAKRSTLDKLLVELPAVMGGVMHLREALEEAEPVDVTLIDCPGTLNVLVVAGILATTVDEEDRRRGAWGVITCTKPAGKEVEGIPVLEDELRKIQKTYRIGVPLLAIVPCAVPPSGDVYREQMEDLAAEYGDIVTPGVRRSAIVDEAYTNYTPIPLYGYRAKPVIEDYKAVLNHLQQKLGMFAARVAAVR